MTKTQITKKLETLRNSVSLIAGEYQELLEKMQEHFDDIDSLNEVADFSL